LVSRFIRTSFAHRGRLAKPVDLGAG
jgi:hypothetical protein